MCATILGKVKECTVSGFRYNLKKKISGKSPQARQKCHSIGKWLQRRREKTGKLKVRTNIDE